MQTALLMIDVQESCPQRPYWSHSGADVFLKHVNALITGAQSRGILRRKRRRLTALPMMRTAQSVRPGIPVSAPASTHELCGALHFTPTSVFFIASAYWEIVPSAISKLLIPTPKTGYCIM